KSDQHRIQVGRRKRKEEMAVNGDLRLLCIKVGERRLTNGLTSASRRREPKPDARDRQVDANDMHRHRSWRRVGSRDVRHAEKWVIHDLSGGRDTADGTREQEGGEARHPGLPFSGSRAK